jgi:hypothetical protein
LPIGAVRQTKDTALVEVDPTRPELLHAVLALMHADDDADDDVIVASPVLGFIHMCVGARARAIDLAHTAHSTNVDIKARKYKILSPQPGRFLPRKKALVGSLDWQDA